MCCFQCSILRQVRVWGEVDHRVCTCDAMGTSSTTSLLLEVNLWSLKLPLIHSQFSAVLDKFNCFLHRGD